MPHAIARANALHLPFADGSAHMCCTSPPYYALRDYPGEPLSWPAVSYSPMAGVAPIEIPAMTCKLGLERSVESFVGHIVAVFREVRRVLRDDGTCWLNMGDSYNGSRKGSRGKTAAMNGRSVADRQKVSPTRNNGLPAKSMIGVPWRCAFALQADGWYLRSDVISDIVWEKPNPMPGSYGDRPRTAHEYIFLLAKSPRYFYDAQAIAQPATGRIPGNKKPHKDAGISRVHSKLGTIDGYAERAVRSIWRISTQPTPEAHFATWPEALVRPMVKAGSSEKGCCPECGAPYLRVVQKERVPTRPGENTKITDGKIAQEGNADAMGWNQPMAIGNRDPKRHVTKVTTKFWKPSCQCKAVRRVPCRVLDPFAGSGTTIKVCELLGRDCLAADLSHFYLSEFARAKMEQAERPHKPRPKRRRLHDPPEDGHQYESLPGQPMLF